MTIQGGYRGNSVGGDPDDRDIVAFVTTLSGDIGNNDGASPPVLTDNSFHVVEIVFFAGTVELSGLTITAGHATESLPYLEQAGGGVYIPSNQETTGSTRIRIVDCTVTGNSAANFGGGVFCYDYSTLELRRSQFVGNSIPEPGSSATGGGAVYRREGVLEIAECFFEENSAAGSNGFGGGAVLGHRLSQVVVANSVFRDNACDTLGGALSAYGTNLGPVILMNCLIHDNDADTAGGVFSAGATTVTNCTIVDNTSFGAPAGVYALEELGIFNSILVGNIAATGTPGFTDQLEGEEDVFIESSCIEGIELSEFPGNVDDNPEFEGASGGNYRLAETSPLIDAGDDDLVADDLADLDEDDATTTELAPWALGPVNMNTDRIICTVDMGAFERELAACPADLTEDGVVDGSDIAVVLGSWGACPGCPADLTDDDEVDGSDIAVILGNWGECPGCTPPENMMMSGTITPEVLAEMFGLESVAEFAAWLDTLEFETMSSILGLLNDA